MDLVNLVQTIATQTRVSTHRGTFLGTWVKNPTSDSMDRGSWSPGLGQARPGSMDRGTFHLPDPL